MLSTVITLSVSYHSSIQIQIQTGASEIHNPYKS